MRGIRKTVIFGVIFSLLLFIMTGCGSSAEKATPAEEPVEAVAETEQEEVVVEESEAVETTVEEETTTEEAEPEVLHNEFFRDSDIPTFELTSEDLHDGVWDTVISNTVEGSNVSPQLTWEAVPDAACYVIYMVDSSAGDWLHWKKNDVTETTLAQGWDQTSDYLGPCPPPGTTHDYEVYVIAIKEPVERAKGALKSSNPNLYANVWALDTPTEGVTGNILAYGHLVGTFTEE